MELHHPEVEGLNHQEGWRYLREALLDVRRGTQKGLGDVLVLIRDLRGLGQRRWATPDEKRVAKETGGDLPSDCWDPAELAKIKPMLSSAIAAMGVSEYVYASVAERLGGGEFGGSKLKSLLACSTAYPVARSVPLMVRQRNVTVSLESPDDAPAGDEANVPRLVVTSLRPHGGKVSLVCRRLHGRGAAGTLATIQKIASGEWAMGAPSVVLRERDHKWYVIVPYTSEYDDDGICVRCREKVPSKSRTPHSEAHRTGRAAEGTSVAVFHRGIANLLTYVIVDGKRLSSGFYVGGGLVAVKRQMAARRAMLGRASSQRSRGRGARERARPLARLADCEARAVETELWRAARWAQRTVETAGVARVILDDFSTPIALHGKDGPIPPWVRSYPLAGLKGKIRDALERRAGCSVDEAPSPWISQTCPHCGLAAEENIARLPRVWLDDPKQRGGLFRCIGCELSMDLDVVAALNLAIWKWMGLKRDDGKEERVRIAVEGKVADVIREAVKRLAKNALREKKLMRSERTEAAA